MPNLPDVLFKIYQDVTTQRNKYPNSYRENNYKIIDDHTFERTPLDGNLWINQRYYELWAHYIDIHFLINNKYNFIASVFSIDFGFVFKKIHLDIPFICTTESALWRQWYCSSSCLELTPYWRMASRKHNCHSHPVCSNFLSKFLKQTK